MCPKIHGWNGLECEVSFYLGVSKNRGGPPKSSILIGFSIINHPFWGTIIFGNTHLCPFGTQILTHDLGALQLRSLETPWCWSLWVELYGAKTEAKVVNGSRRRGVCWGNLETFGYRETDLWDKNNQSFNQSINQSINHSINQWILFFSGDRKAQTFLTDRFWPQEKKHTSFLCDFFLDDSNFPWIFQTTPFAGRAKKLGIRFMFEVDPSSSMLLALYVLICWLQTAAEQLHVPGYQAFKRRCRVHDFEETAATFE